MAVPEGLHSSYNGVEEDEEQEAEKEAPVALSTYHTDPKLTEEEQANADANAEAESEGGDDGGE